MVILSKQAHNEQVHRGKKFLFGQDRVFRETQELALPSLIKIVQVTSSFLKILAVFIQRMHQLIYLDVITLVYKNRRLSLLAPRPILRH